MESQKPTPISPVALAVEPLMVHFKLQFIISTMAIMVMILLFLLTGKKMDKKFYARKNYKIKIKGGQYGY